MGIAEHGVEGGKTRRKRTVGGRPRERGVKLRPLYAAECPGGRNRVGPWGALYDWRINARARRSSAGRRGPAVLELRERLAGPRPLRPAALQPEVGESQPGSEEQQPEK